MLSVGKTSVPALLYGGDSDEGQKTSQNFRTDGPQDMALRLVLVMFLKTITHFVGNPSINYGLAVNQFSEVCIVAAKTFTELP